MKPENGRSISRMRKSAPVADSAQMNKAAMTTGSARMNRLKLAKITASQNTRMAKNGVGIELARLRVEREARLARGR